MVFHILYLLIHHNKFIKGVIIKQIKIFLLLLLIFLFMQSLNAKTINVAFINGRDNVGFWKDVENFMLEVAKDFDDIKLTIYRAKSNHLKQLRILEEITSSSYKTKYDVVLTRALGKNGIQLLDIAEKNKTPIFLFNTGLDEKQIAIAGAPRQNYKYFIGEMYPDDEQAGFDLASELVSNYELISTNGKINLLALSAGPGNLASVTRVKGLKRFLKNNKDKVKLLQVLPVYKLDDHGLIGASKKTKLALKRYKKINLIWGYNDAIAIGSLNVILKDQSYLKAHGKTLFSGGIDWTKQAIEFIENDKMSYTLGGHYMDGGWSLIAVYDYLKGKDFKDSQGIVTFGTKLSTINKKNLEGFKTLFIKNKVKEIDFKSFSIYRNPNLKEYNFGLDLLLNKLK